MTRGMYGKFVGGIEVVPVNEDVVSVTFEYLLNPDGTTNMEFDTKMNLFDKAK